MAGSGGRTKQRLSYGKMLLPGGLERPPKQLSTAPIAMQGLSTGLQLDALRLQALDECLLRLLAVQPGEARHVHLEIAIRFQHHRDAFCTPSGVDGAALLCQLVCHLIPHLLQGRSDGIVNHGELGNGKSLMALENELFEMALRQLRLRLGELDIAPCEGGIHSLQGELSLLPLSWAEIRANRLQ